MPGSVGSNLDVISLIMFPYDLNGVIIITL